MIRLFKITEPTRFDENINSCALALGFNDTLESLTRDVPVKGLHSHNDYWRERPLFDALSVGAQSIESDIWVYNDSFSMERTYTQTTKSIDYCADEAKSFEENEIYVGHAQVYLEPEKTLSAMYLDPLLYFLDYSNPSLNFAGGNSEFNIESGDSKNGVFYDSTETPLYLWFDFKTDPTITYNALKKLIQPFIDRGYLAYYDTETEKYVPGPLVLTITGNLPKDLVKKETKRYLFLDAPLQKFNSDNDELKDFQGLSVVASSSVSQIIGDAGFSASHFGAFDNASSSLISTAIETAHKLNFKTRIWGDIDWPIDARNKHLDTIFSLGTDFLNVDDLEYASTIF